MISFLLFRWNDWAYFGYRDPVVINVNYFFQFQDDYRPQFSSQTGRASSIIQAALEFRRLTLSGELPPESAKNQPLCSIMYKFLFNTCRVPEMPSDTTIIHDHNVNKHVAVVRKNQFFFFDVLDENNKPLSTAEIETQLKRIVDAAGSTPDAHPLGILTTENRDTWTKARNDIIRHSYVNAEALKKIETSIFLVCLDDTKPVTREEVGRALWHGDGKNRYFDKSIQFIVFENGKAGFNGEHSMMDATPTSRLCDFVLTNLFTNKIDHGTSSGKPLPAPTKIKVDLSPVKKLLPTAEKNFKALVDKHQVSVLVFDNYGKDFIKRAKQSPDAYVQMAMQLAYYKMYGVCRPTYESSQVRKFAYGRTETTRSVSIDSVAFVKAMQDPKESDANKLALLQKAVNAHGNYMADAVEGKGVDRHLLGLRLIANEINLNPKPAMFTDPAFSYSATWYLSTSQITSEYYDNYGWGEVVPQGYGIPYMIKEVRKMKKCLFRNLFIFSLPVNIYTRIDSLTF
jgi:carnitine O-acetyltransferase